MSPTKLLLVLIALLCGCAETRVMMRGTLERESSPWTLRFENSGRAFVGSQQLFLPSEAEYKHFGITVVDGSSLPQEWTHGTAQSRTVLVSLIDRASPLAAAGIRPYDRILEINGEKATLASFRRHIHTAYSVKLKYQRPS
ncbi:MAG: PDZ domain-containing protein, partial [Planctomycetota bacterium]|nr:PDZ domain-containing protein [Planctomycetota bacterium]